MDRIVKNMPLYGVIPAIASKSQVHRALICAAFADGVSKIIINAASKDIDATANCLRALGAKINQNGEIWEVTPIKNKSAENPLLACGESGSTFRFLLPVAAAAFENVSFCGEGRLPERPIGPLMDEMKKHGSVFSAEKLPFSVSKLQNGGDFYLPGNVSSQFASGLLMAAPILPEGVQIHFDKTPESMGYIEMTVHMLKNFGVAVEKTEDGFSVAKGQHYHAVPELSVEGDWSNAAFWLCGAAIAGEVTVTGLALDSAQGDRAVLNVLREMGAEIKTDGNSVTVKKSELKATVIDAREIPDLVPVLSLTAALAEGETRVIHAARLRIKESDRLKTTTELLSGLGADITELEDGLIICGKDMLFGGEADGANDHRIVMTAAIAASRSENPVLIKGTEAAAKSYPAFFEDLEKIGGHSDVVLR